jgi:ribose transport system substrate-binding protein
MTTTSPVEPRTSPRTGIWVVLAALAILIVVGLLWAQGAFAPKPRIAIVTASSGPYWDLILKGAQDAADRHGVRLEKITPASDEPSQSKAISELVGKDYDGVAVSPNDGAKQARTLADVAADTNLVTFDADSAISRRLCFVGTNNYDAGRMCGRHVREALPQGGSVMIAIGSVEKENGHRRRQGLIDELLERQYEPFRLMDPVEGSLKGPKYTVVATVIHGLDPQRSSEAIAAAVKDQSDVDCIVGLFASSTPAVLKALDQSGKLGTVKVIGFDANTETLDGIEKGHVQATIVQDAYNIGYQAVRILADAAAGEANAIPLYPTFYLECDEVTADNLAEMKQAMASRVKPPRRAKDTNTEAAATKPAEPAASDKQNP